MQLNPKRLAVALAPLFMMTLPGCAMLMPDKVTTHPMEKPVHGSPNTMPMIDDVTNLPTGGDAVVLDMQPLVPDEPLPDTMVPPIAATGIGYVEALRLLLDGSRYSLSVEGDVKRFELASQGSIRIPGGKLSEVAERLSRSGGFFLTVRDGQVVVSPTKQFVVEVPPALDRAAAEGFFKSLARLGVREAFYSSADNTISFEASRTGWAAVESYLGHLRRSKPMLVYEVEVYQVELRDGDTKGLGWSSIAKNLAGNPTNWALSKASESLSSAGVAFVGKNVTFNAVVDLLQTQGTVSSLSRPRVAMLSGTKAKFRVGATTKYVSKIAQSGSQTAESAIITSSSETDEVKTGFDLQMSGVYEEHTVFTNMNLSISALVRFNDFEAFGTKLRLPDTTEREIQTSVRARPGDLILLGGLGSSAQSDDRAGGAAGVSKKSEATQSEIVVAMRPRVVRFVSAKEAQQ